MAIKTWEERCAQDPAHDGVILEDMMHGKMLEEIHEHRILWALLTKSRGKIDDATVQRLATRSGIGETIDASRLRYFVDLVAKAERQRLLGAAESVAGPAVAALQNRSVDGVAQLFVAKIEGEWRFDAVNRNWMRFDNDAKEWRADFTDVLLYEVGKFVEDTYYAPSYRMLSASFSRAVLNKVKVDPRIAFDGGPASRRRWKYR